MADTPTVAPYGSWPSPITAARLVEGAAAVGEVRVDGPDVWWSEQRPSEGGRTQLVRRSADGSLTDLFAPWVPEPSGAERNWNARTALLEYGGGAWAVREGVVVFADWADQRLHRAEPGGVPTPLTPEPSVARGWRYSEPTWLDERWLVCVRESHEPEVVAENGEAVDELVAVPLDGSAADDPGRVRVLVSGPDFVHTPAVDGTGALLAWLAWDHPAMPWDGTRLVVGVVARDADGAPVGVDHRVQVAGGVDESVVQPGFTGAGDLVFCSDRTGWWNPWSCPGGRLHEVLRASGVLDADDVRPLVTAGIDAEIGGGLWVGGLRWWAEIGPERLLASARSEGADALVVVADGVALPLGLEVTEVAQVVAGPEPGTAVVAAASPVREALPMLLSGGPLRQHDGDGTGGGVAAGLEVELLRSARDLGIDERWFSVPRHLTFPSASGRVAHALHYPPTNPEVEAPAGERPPLLVMLHGGPTSAARHRLDLTRQFWTSRGFAVVDVNYGGSTGYGRPYRSLLREAWGVVDVEDAVAAAEHLAAEGLADPDRLAIRGGSAGGYTTLAALCFHDTFAAGASHYGIADLTALAADTHKFERRYLDGLVGPWPEARDRYEARSPIHHTASFDRPLIVLQGSEDEVVPPDQAERIVEALAAKGVPHAYVLFEGEQHGFRRAESIIAALEAELWFYGRVFGFTPADPLEPVAGAVGL
jgi:dipeptidyl aminopeptidase/acylaminoacyl peptidase